MRSTPIAPTPLYVKRDVLNADDIITWAKAQGFHTATKPEDMHVTITYSKAPVLWADMGPDLFSDLSGNITVPAFDGPRTVSPLGDKGAVVLKFQCSALTVRHNEMMRHGASWDFPGYMPHVTLTYDGGDVDLATVEPWTGPIVLGAEVFEVIEESWADTKEEAVETVQS